MTRHSTWFAGLVRISLVTLAAVGEAKPIAVWTVGSIDAPGHHTPELQVRWHYLTQSTAGGTYHFGLLLFPPRYPAYSRALAVRK